MNKSKLNIGNSVKCRLCLKEEFKLKDIFKNKSCQRMAKKIRQCTDVIIELGDGYSTMICSGCYKKLNNAYKFRKKCQQSAHVLLMTLPSSTKLQEIDGSPAAEKCDAWSDSDDECIKRVHEEKNIESAVTKTEDEFIESDKDSSVSMDATEPMKMFDDVIDCKQEIEILDNVDNLNHIVNNHVDHLDDKKKCRSSKGFTRRKTKDKTEQCSECGKLYKSAGYLAHHMRIHNNDKSLDINNEAIEGLQIPEGCQKYNYRPFTCSVCGKGFTQAGNLAVHHRSHTGERPFQCDICFKAFTQVGNLYVHKRVHADFREFKCELCPMDFKLLSHLGEHMKTHSGVKEHQCMTCGKGFHKSSHLLTHLRTHTGEKPFSCEHCGRFFNDSSNLATHIRIHTGTRPFICKHCNKGFAQKISMIRHEKQHTLGTKCKKPSKSIQLITKKDEEQNFTNSTTIDEFENISDANKQLTLENQFDINNGSIACKTDSGQLRIWHV